MTDAETFVLAHQLEFPDDRTLLARIMVMGWRVSAPKHNQETPVREPKGQRQKGGSEKLIRLDDLIPKGNVKGGRQLFFGASDTLENNKQKDH